VSPANANLHAVDTINGVANEDGGRNRQHTGPRVSDGHLHRNGLSIGPRAGRRRAVCTRAQTAFDLDRQQASVAIRPH
jgi:hypothetical protein